MEKKEKFWSWIGIRTWNHLRVTVFKLFLNYFWKSYKLKFMTIFVLTTMKFLGQVLNKVAAWGDIFPGNNNF